MLRSTLRLVAAVLLAVGLVCAPPVSLDANAKAKKAAAKTSSKKSSKKEVKRGKNAKTAKKEKSSKRGSKDRVAKSSKRNDRSRATKSTRSTRRGKNDDDNQVSRSRRTAPTPAPVAKKTVDSFDGDDEDAEEAEEPPGPRPANRLVSDISSTRVTQIQAALIQKGFLTGPATGVYDQPTFQAMAAFQSRNGWNPNGNPTADALKALGVPKTSGRPLMTPARMLEATAPPR